MQGPHVVAVRQAEVDIESMTMWQVIRMVTQVPFAEASCRVTLRLTDLGDRGLIMAESNRSLGA